VKAQYGGNADAALSIFNLDPAGLHGKNFQGAMGLDPLKDAFDELKKRQTEFNTNLGGTLGKIKELGGNLPEALKPYIEQLKNAKVLTQDNIDLLEQMGGSNTVSWEQMQEAAEKYGISLDALGQDFKDAKMHQSWQELIDDMDLLQRGGADMNGVFEGMKDEIQDLVKQSMHFGTTIPENMRPWIQKMIDAGELLDESGNKITDIGKLHFGDTMQTTLDKLNDTLQALIEALGVKLPAAAHAAGQAWQDSLGGLPMPGGGGGPGGKPNPGPGDGGTPTAPAALHFNFTNAVIANQNALDELTEAIGAKVVESVGGGVRFAAMVR